MLRMYKIIVEIYLPWNLKGKQESLADKNIPVSWTNQAKEE